jgi:uncharacterized protein YqcC (DUF446 family)
MSKSAHLASLLIDVEACLRQLELWEQQPPSAEALASTQPFCIDTLNFAQWLQYVFLPTMYHLLAEDMALPTECGIAPMAEEYFRGQELPCGELESALAAIDRLLTVQEH